MKGSEALPHRAERLAERLAHPVAFVSTGRDNLVAVFVRMADYAGPRPAWEAIALGKAVCAAAATPARRRKRGTPGAGARSAPGWNERCAPSAEVDVQGRVHVSRGEALVPRHSLAQLSASQVQPRGCHAAYRRALD